MNNLYPFKKREHGCNAVFNMTPIIDIVFLLIVFFLVVFRFIEAENFPVEVPQSCKAADNDTKQKPNTVSVTVLQNNKKEISYAVGSSFIEEDAKIDEQLKEMLETQFASMPESDRKVNLRIDRNIDFADAQYALLAVSQSSATKLKIAVLSNHK